MATEALITETRVILADTATREDLQAMAALHPTKTVVRANTLRVPGANVPDDKVAKQMAELTQRVRSLENQFAALLQSASAAPVASRDVTAPKVEPEEPAREEPRPAVTKTEVARPSVSEPVATERKRDKYDAMDKEELLRRVAVRKGNAAKIMAPYHARARTNALKDWLRANPAVKIVKAAKPAVKAKAVKPVTKKPATTQRRAAR